MSKAKLITKFLGAVAKKGISYARKAEGTSAERELKGTASGLKKLEAAKQEFKDTKVGKKPDLPKAKKSKATQKNLRMKKNYEVQEGMGLDATTGRSNRAAAEVDAGEGGRVTKGTKSVNNFAADQRATSPGMRARSSADKKAYKKIMDAREEGNTKLEKELRAKQKEVEAKRKKVDESAKDSARRKAGTARAGSKRSEAVKLPETKTLGSKKTKDTRTPRVNPKTGEIINSEAFDELPINRQISLMRDAVARAEGPTKRRIRAQIEKLLIKQGKTKAGETSVGARKGEKGMRGASSNPSRRTEGTTGKGSPTFKIGGMVDKKYTNPVMVLDRRKKK